jgi:hypothetical protein
MNKKILVIISLTLIALIIIYLYSFGPLAKNRLAHSINQASTIPIVEKNTQITFNAYHNKDTKEDYYGIKTPSTWKLATGVNPGGYIFNVEDMIFQSELMDVPDNTTLELYVLSQEEPRLKKGNNQYKKISYAKIMVNNNSAYQLTYQFTKDAKLFNVMKTYITGPDKSGVITITIPQEKFANQQPVITQFLNSFNWENI